MLKLKTILQYSIIYYVILLLTLIYALVIFLNPKKTSSYIDENNFTGYVYDYKMDGDKLSFVLNAKEKIQATYYFKSLAEKDFYMDNFKYGLMVNINGQLSEPTNNTVPNTFNYKLYLNYHHIYKIINVDSITFLASSSHFIFVIKNFINNRLKSIEYGEYIKTFILGDKSGIDADDFNNYKKLGVTHLFAISGMHIGLFATVILLIFKKMKIAKNKSLFLSIVLIGLYSLLTGFPASVRRAFVLYVLIVLNKIFDIRIKTLNLLVLAIAINIIVDPFIIFDIGFLYSASTTFGLILASQYLNSKNYFKKMFRVSLIAYLFSMPITINNFYEINLLTPLNNLFIVPLVSLFIYPLSIITFIIPFLSPIFSISINALLFLNNMLININFLNIVIAKLSVLEIIIYYIVLIWLINKKNKLLPIIIIVFLLMKLCLSHCNSNSYVYYFDVGQGDSAIIIGPYNQKVIMIDTGGKLKYQEEDWQIKKSVSHVTDGLILFLKSLGISHIDNLILSHGDYDHMGDAINLVNNFKVENVTFNCGEYNDLERKLINVLNNKKINYYSCIKELNIDKYKLEFLNTGIYDNENDNSNVIYYNYNNYKFLFMGDAGVQREKDILEEYNLSNIDFLKVGHHGSNTSSSEYFIKKIQPKYSLISVGKDNRYGHPKESVIEILNHCKIYRTDKDGSIEIKFNKNGYKISTWPP